MSVPKTAASFDFAYRLPLTPWGDPRIPPELVALADRVERGRTLELGCGLGRFSSYLARRGFDATAIDFSEVAIGKARKRASSMARPPRFLVGDVTKLDALSGPYDLAVDVGCFHCLDADAHRLYAAEQARLLRPGASLLVWAMDDPPPSGVRALSPVIVASTFEPAGLALTRYEASRRRLARSHWYWLTR